MYFHERITVPARIISTYIFDEPNELSCVPYLRHLSLSEGVASGDRHPIIIFSWCFVGERPIVSCLAVCIPFTLSDPSSASYVVLVVPTLPGQLRSYIAFLCVWVTFLQMHLFILLHGKVKMPSYCQLYFSFFSFNSIPTKVYSILRRQTRLQM